MAADPPHPTFAAYASESVPQAAVGSPGKDGRLELTFATDSDGRTRLVRDRARAPFHVSGTLDTDPHPDAVTVMVQSSNGGVAQGDRNRLAITAKADAVASVTTGSATKVFSMDRNYGATERSVSIGASGHVGFVPEPTILHSDARYCETTTVSLASDATAVIGEVVVPGRLAREERFDFERYLSRLRVRTPDRLLFEDATHLCPDGGDDPRGPTVPGVLGAFAVYGTLYVVAPDVPRIDDALHEHVTTAPCRAGATALPNGAGAVVRALGERTDAVTQTLHAAREVARQRLFGVSAPDRRA